MHPERLRCYLEPVTLEDGGVISVRAIRPSDKPLILGLFHSMGPDSIRHRVFASKSDLTESELAYLTELDFVRHVALVATTVSVEGVEEIIGVARYCRLTPRRSSTVTAEIAFAVADRHQGRGIGTTLLARLEQVAREEGVAELDADVMIDNSSMMHVFASAGFKVGPSADAGIYHFSLPLEPDVEASVRSDHVER